MSISTNTNDATFSIYQEKELVAQFFNMEKFDSTSFPTPGDQEMQFGFGKIEAKKELDLHIHKSVSRQLNNTSEFLYVISGRMDIDIYGQDEIFITTITLHDNQALLQYKGGHKITISKNTKYFEIKQGPYLGQNIDKYYLES